MLQINHLQEGFILVRIAVDPKPIPGILDVRWEFLLLLNISVLTDVIAAINSLPLTSCSVFLSLEVKMTKNCHVIITMLTPPHYF